MTNKTIAEDKPMEKLNFGRCRDCTKLAVHYNSFNKVYQCHSCGDAGEDYYKLQADLEDCQDLLRMCEIALMNEGNIKMLDKIKSYFDKALGEANE